MHPHFCECDDCLNRGGGLPVERLKPRDQRFDSPGQRHRTQVIEQRRRRQAKRKAREAARV